jgi:hypothetical protein
MLFTKKKNKKKNPLLVNKVGIVRWPDWIEFEKNQNPNHIKYFGIGFSKIITRYDIGPGWINPLIFGLE